MRASDLGAMLRTLTGAAVECVFIGGVAELLRGSSEAVHGVAVVIAKNSRNAARFSRLVETVDGIFRAEPGRRLKPSAEMLTGNGRLNLLTRYGPLDVMCTVGQGLTYEGLLPDSSEMDIGAGARIRVLHMEKLVELRKT